jgi:hypothetical protein
MDFLGGSFIVLLTPLSPVSRSPVGLVTRHSDLQRPSTGSIWRPISRTTGGVDFCPLDRAVGVNPGFSLRYRMRLVVLVPQHQADGYETYD